MALVRLPSTSGPFTSRTAIVDAERLAAIQHYISKLWSPFECPSQFLPHLAWALSVDVWDDNWSETRKRQMIAAAPEIHRRKGTAKAVELALNAFGLTYDDVEWWETNPIGVRGTFAIDILHSDVGDYLDEDLQEQIYLAVKASKPKSRVFDIRHYMGMDCFAYVGSFATSVIDVTLASDQPDPLVQAPMVWTGTFIQSEIVVELT